MTGGSIMRRINGEKFGRWSLRLDAAYCTMLGAAVALFAGPVSEGVALPPPLIVATGVAVVVWAGGIMWMLARLPLRSALRFVMAANMLAALAVFATSQAVALRALPARG